MGGRLHRAIERQHNIYGKLAIAKQMCRCRTNALALEGSVFRVSPNELSFASVASWKDIYGHQPAGRQTLVKSEFYDMYGSGFNSLCIGSERNPQKHRQMKTSLSAAFSTKALQEQEYIVAKVVDSFIAKINGDTGPDGMNMTKWYEMVAFDILGEMAFGNSFHCIENGQYLWTAIEASG